MATEVTQCPKCSTSFRVTDTQLTIANGAVRCGSCLHIFNAADYWLSTTGSSNSAQVAINNDENPDDQLSLNDIFDDDIFADDTDLDLLADQVMAGNESVLDEFDAEDSNTGKPRPSYDIATLLDDDDLSSDTDSYTNTRSFMTTEEDIAALDSLGPSVIKVEDDIDEDWAKELLASEDENYGTSDNLEQPELAPKPAEDDDNFSVSFLELDLEEDDQEPVFTELDNLADEEETNENWAQKLIDAEEDETNNNYSAPSTVEAEPENEPTTETESDNKHSTNDEDPFEHINNLFDSLEEGQDQQPLDAELGDTLNSRDNLSIIEDRSDAEPAFDFANESMVAGERIGDTKQRLIANIEPEPIEIVANRDPDHWRRRAWLASIAAAILLLASQYLVFNFERLARDNNYRPLLISGCELLGCQVPELDDIRQISSSNLMVRSHPKQANALVVDAILINRAPFKQPFPEMELQFTNLAGKVVAGRRFSPEQYLSGELSGNQIMPIKQPIHISLDIIDPGTEAINYQIRFHPQRRG
ncbi:MAG: putative Zn finger-like uncharacterized protein [Oceanicoccus sp.]|jgi:predicted Zn finger-like uncharacterized protein